MKCSRKCKFYDCWVSSDSQLTLYCKRRGIDIVNLPQSIRDNCDKFLESSYKRKDILNDKY